MMTAMKKLEQLSNALDKLDSHFYNDDTSWEELVRTLKEARHLATELKYGYVDSLTFYEPTKEPTAFYEPPEPPKLTEKEEIKYALDELLDWAEAGLDEWHGDKGESLEWYNKVLGALDLDEAVEGKHNRVYPTGAQRDSDDGKPKLTYIPWDLMDRVAFHYEKGALKYGDDNWRLGMPSVEVLDSLMRHVRKYFMAMDDEDHLSAIIFNAFCLIYNEDSFADNPDVYDLPKWWVEKGFRKE